MDIEYFVIFVPRKGKSTLEYSFVDKELLDQLLADKQVLKSYEVTHDVHTKEEIDKLLTNFSQNK